MRLYAACSDRWSTSVQYVKSEEQPSPRYSRRASNSASDATSCAVVCRSHAARRVTSHPSMAFSIDRLTQVEVLAGRHKPSAITQQSEADLQHLFAHPPELVQQFARWSIIK